MFNTSEIIHKMALETKQARASSVNENSLEYKVHVAARDNMSLTLYALLSQKNHEEVKKLLHNLTEEDGQKTTPLIIAGKNGHDKVVQMLMNFYKVDVEMTGTVKFDGFVIDGATPLWCASGAGHYAVVKLLLDYGADINKPTFTNSTPLRAACFDGRLDIVRYLISNGADIHIPNKYKNTCLMIACYKGHEEVVRHLLECGVEPNSQAHCGATALHFASERGYLQIVKDVIMFGGRLQPNDERMTPLHVAAESSQAAIVEYFISRPECSRLDQIHSLELLGASYANDKDNYDVEKCYCYLWLAMNERFKNPKNCIRKAILPPLDAYDNHAECQTIEELELIRDNNHAIHMEALVLRERILGEDNAEIPHPVIFRGAVFADAAQFDRCTALWLRALHLHQRNNRNIAKDLMRFSQVFSQMIHVGVQVKLKLALLIFEHMLIELGRDLEKCCSTSPDVSRDPDLPEDLLELNIQKEELLDLNIHTSLYLLYILHQIKRTEEEDFTVCKAVYRYNRLQLHLKNGSTPLHMICDDKTAIDDFHVNDVVHFPSDTLVSLVIHCGAEVNATDNEGNSPLHTIVRYNRPISDFLTLHNIIVNFLEAGCHSDRVNNNGETASEWSTTGVAEIILRTRRKLSLKCIAARAVKKHNITYQSHIPTTLEDFVKMH